MVVIYLLLASCIASLCLSFRISWINRALTNRHLKVKSPLPNRITSSILKKNHRTNHFNTEEFATFLDDLDYVPKRPLPTITANPKDSKISKLPPTVGDEDFTEQEKADIIATASSLENVPDEEGIEEGDEEIKDDLDYVRQLEELKKQFSPPPPPKGTGATGSQFGDEEINILLQFMEQFSNSAEMEDLILTANRLDEDEKADKAELFGAERLPPGVTRLPSFLKGLQYVPNGKLKVIEAAAEIEAWRDAKENELNEAKSVLALSKIYSKLLQDTCRASVDPMQRQAFCTLAGTFATRLATFFPKEQDLATVMETVTDAHLVAIHKVLSSQSTSASDETAMEANLPALCQHFAHLAYYTTFRIADVMDQNPEKKMSEDAMRENVFMAPVLARLQSRVPEFAIMEAVKLHSDGLMELLTDRVPLELSPKLKLPSESTDFAIKYPELGDSHRFLAGDLVRFTDKFMRKSLQASDMVPRLESNVRWAYRQSLAKRMKNSLSPLLAVYREIDAMDDKKQEQDSARAEELGRLMALEERKMAANYLNLAHESAAAVFMMWQVRHNYVGVCDDEEEEGYVHDSHKEQKEKIYRWDFISLPWLPALHTTDISTNDSMPTILQALPPKLRSQVEFSVQELAQMYQPNALLTSAAIYAVAVRHTAFEHFRGLSLSKENEESFSGESVYATALAELLTSTLLAKKFDEHRFYQHLIGFAALEENLAVSGPRLTREALDRALLATGLRLREQIQAAVPVDRRNETVTLPEKVNEFVEEVRQRVNTVERALYMMLGLEQEQYRLREEGEEAGVEPRTQAFHSLLDKLMAPESDVAPASVKEMQRDVPWIARVLSLDPIWAQNVLTISVQHKFDAFVNELFLNADVAVSMPSLGASFEKRLLVLADSLLMTREQAVTRVVGLAGSAMSSMLIGAAQQHQQKEFEKVDGLMEMAFNIYEHPLVKRLQEKHLDEDVTLTQTQTQDGMNFADFKEHGLRMTLHQLNEAAEGVDLLTMIRMVEAARARRIAARDGRTPPKKASRQGWGVAEEQDDSPPQPEIPGVLEFVQFIQEFLLEEYSAASFR